MGTIPSISVPLNFESHSQEFGSRSITDQAEAKKSDQKDRLKGKIKKGEEKKIKILKEMMKVNMVKVRRIGKVKTIQISCGVFARRHITIDLWFAATAVTSGIMANASELQGFSNDVPELKSRLEYATGRRQPIKTTTKRVGATHVKPMASKPSVYGQQIAPTAKFAPQHNIAPQPPAYGQQRTTNATPITSLPSQQVAPAQPSLYGNQRPSTPSIVSQ
ncbi:uncharacterized protein LOC136039257 isoform X2 [Artemia franciscana]|uniref:uncharacterized protein LOC136039257 isoform X2 n=1 Tax=Artemia franciscana TaxID=6661 RepID=UPI0032DBC58F